MSTSAARWLLPLTIAVSGTAAVLLAVQMWRSRPGTLPTDQLDALRLVHRQILEDYPFDAPPDDLVYRAIEGMVASLDRYSRFVQPAEVERFEQDEITGTYEGIGMLPVAGRNPVTVQWPFPDGPAARAGLRVGDELLQIDGEPVEFENAVERLLGRTGSHVLLSIRRDGAPPFDVDVVRASVRKASVKWAHLLGDRIGYVWVAEFQQGMVEQLDRELARLRAEAGGELLGLVVDLRNDPGGLLTEAITCANRFLRTGRIVSLKKRGGEIVEAHDAAPEQCTFPDVPLAVIVDRGSASASEVVAGALQDHRRARIVGERTFGKGVVPTIYTWPKRSFRLKLTSAHYYTPNGRNLARRRGASGEDIGGVTPDVVAGVSEDQQQRLHARLADFETPHEYAAEVDALAAKLGFTVALPITPEEDPQLAAALAALRLPVHSSGAIGDDR
jgi:carboxyl-terminal processing protease